MTLNPLLRFLPLNPHNIFHMSAKDTPFVILPCPPFIGTSRVPPEQSDHSHSYPRLLLAANVDMDPSVGIYHFQVFCIYLSILDIALLQGPDFCTYGRGKWSRIAP